MSVLEWRENSDGYQSGGYVIRRLEEWPVPRWRLEASDVVAPWSGSHRLTMSVHATVRAAKYQALRDETDRIRRARLTAHFLIGIAASLAFSAVAGTALARSEVGFVVAMMLFYLVVGSFADVVDVWLGDAEAWTHSGARQECASWSERLVLVAVDGLHRRTLASARATPTSAVLTLPPKP